ncbi:hypothetical protein BH09BAC4_BH09BAC4_05270 [soil metagenome]
MLFFLTVFQLINYQGFTQNKQLDVTAPTLKNGKMINNSLRLGYQGETDTYIVITMKFKISATGVLDTLSISDNAPKTFVDAAKEQLSKLDGLWNPQRINGKPVQSKWFISRFYIGGYREDKSTCAVNAQNEFFNAFKREEEIFLCDKKMEPPLKCLIDYVEGSNCYLLPPLLSDTVR